MKVKQHIAISRNHLERIVVAESADASLHNADTITQCAVCVTQIHPRFNQSRENVAMIVVTDTTVHKDYKRWKGDNNIHGNGCSKSYFEWRRRV